ncbi:MAG TPA: alkaline phosphatase family protein, partial [Pyrinomonadaceae bacterium]|nr:alkaline phosphatase family protein [Pyrinomonadaceae bacterium]
MRTSSKAVVSWLLTTILLILLAHVCAQAQAKRLVVLKVDGLQPDILDRFVRERSPTTGKSLLPWVEHVFYERGTRLKNFYVRGMSLSGPSWSMIDTGQHLQIKGNVEYDRLTLHTYDYLNFLPFYISNIGRRRVDMPGAETLDEAGIPLLVDAYAQDERFMSFQLYQRGMRWSTLQRGMENRFLKNPRELLDEWTTGFETRSTFFDQLERELIERLNDPRFRYLDLYLSDFDHAAHHNRDRETHLYALQALDGVVGRVWTAIQKTPEAADTALVLVSDHGVNTDERVYSQGYNLVHLLGSREGGGHHVITKRRLLLDYSIKGFYPLVPLITTTTDDTYYLKGQSTAYPTALLDFDGNERASIHLRASDLNVLHILLQQLQRKDLPDAQRRAMTETFFKTLDRRREEWGRQLAEIKEEVGALGRANAKQRQVLDEWKRLDEERKKREKKEKKGAQGATPADEAETPRGEEKLRAFARLDSSTADERDYTEYARTLTNLLSLTRENFDPRRLKIEDFIAKGAMGNPNSIHDLQNYVVGLVGGGPVLAQDGSLDVEKSFVRVNYFRLLHEVAMRNNVQPGVDPRPVDFVAVRLPADRIAAALAPELRPNDDVVWIYDGPENQALILSRTDEAGRLSLRYLPVSNLTEDAAGTIQFTKAQWRARLPLRIWEDARLDVPAGARNLWLENWHTDLEW